MHSILAADHSNPVVVLAIAAVDIRAAVAVDNNRVDPAVAIDLAVAATGLAVDSDHKPGQVLAAAG